VSTPSQSNHRSAHPNALTPSHSIPSSVHASNITAPRVRNLITDFTFSHEIRLPPLQIYQTAIALMYDLAQLGWENQMLAMIASHIEGYKVLMMFINPHRPEASVPQLQVSHCVDTLFRAVSIMTDGILFCQLRCKLSVSGKEIGAFTVATTDDAVNAPPSVEGDVDTAGGGSSVGTLPYGRGLIVDPDNFLFVIEYQWMNKAIKPQEISLAILDALAQAAVHDKDAAFQEIEAVSPGGECGIFIDRVRDKPVLKPLTYRYATRALRLMFDEIVVPQKRWGDVYLKLTYNEEHFGDVRVLKFVGGRNGTTVVAEAR